MEGLAASPAFAAGNFFLFLFLSISSLLQSNCVSVWGEDLLRVETSRTCMLKRRGGEVQFESESKTGEGKGYILKRLQVVLALRPQLSPKLLLFSETLK